GRKKWYQKIAYYFLEVAILNSYVLYEKVKMGEGLDRKKYMICIIEPLLNYRNEGISTETTTKLVTLGYKECFLTGSNHALNCALCNLGGRRKRSSFKCGTCNQTLCIIECYDKHRVQRKS